MIYNIKHMQAHVMDVDKDAHPNTEKGENDKERDLSSNDKEGEEDQASPTDKVLVSNSLHIVFIDYTSD